MFQTSSPAELKILAVIEGGKAKETEFHVQFADLRVNGEWFKPLKPLLNYIKTLPRYDAPPCRKHGGGRPKQFHHRVLIPFATDTLERIEKALEPKQTRTDFIRGAVDERLAKSS